MCRYDGYNVKVFQNEPDDTTSLSNIYVKSTITEDTNGYLWVGSLNGLNRFDPITEKFTRYFHDPNDQTGKSGKSVRYTYLDREGTVWIGVDGAGLNRYIDSTDRFEGFLPSPDYSLSNTIRGIYDDSSGILWVGTRNGLYQFDRATKKFHLIK